MPAKEQELLKCPTTASIRLSVAKRVATAFASFSVPTSSPKMSLSCLPLMTSPASLNSLIPPASLISFALSSAPRLIISPKAAAFPVNGPATATLTSFPVSQPSINTKGTNSNPINQFLINSHSLILQ